MATTQYSIRLVKTFPYRGNPVKEFSNRYYFDGGAPGSSAAEDALMDAVVAKEKAIFAARTTIIGAHIYAPGSEVAIASKTYAQAGTFAGAGGELTPGDCVAVLRMATTKMTERHHRVYVFSYFHDVRWTDGSNAPDTVYSVQKTAYETYGNDWLNGIVVGGRTYKRTTPDGAATTGRVVNPMISHRDFPR